MIHHEKITATLVSERESDSGVGDFDVIEDGDGFHVYDGRDGLNVATCTTLADATAEAYRLAEQFDADRRAKGWSHDNTQA